MACELISAGYPISCPLRSFIHIRFHGSGVLHFPNGGKFEAQWENGSAVGPGTGVSQHTLTVRDYTRRVWGRLVLKECTLCVSTFHDFW